MKKLVSVFVFIIICLFGCSTMGPGVTGGTVEFYKSLLAESNEKYNIQYASSIDILDTKGRGAICGGTVIQREKGKPIAVVSAAHCFPPKTINLGKVGDTDIEVEVDDPVDATVQQCLKSGQNRCFNWDMKIVILNRDLDLALLIGKTPEKFDGPSVKIALQVPIIGDAVILIGAPAGRSRTMSFGHVTNIQLEDHTSEVIHYYSDAAVFFGNSGGGMFNENGELIGVMHTAFTPMPPIIIHGFAAAIGVSYSQLKLGAS